MVRPKTRNMFPQSLVFSCRGIAGILALVAGAGWFGQAKAIDLSERLSVAGACDYVGGDGR